MKKCSKCKKLLPETEFSKASGGKYLRSECKACNNKLRKEREALRKIYGNPPKDYTCPICTRKEHQLEGVGNKKNSPWVLDPDRS